ncbi:hypothetical protein BDN70DRAFT_891865 [Pholiota conissans]|uniref:non-specific serine/threonine protein kinase n=1 Tax=Pholiota conissans TaxID=109636 RepID=A0A9P5ZAJ5_9AGAR|nr:hypothetical protein BDN70DRAFT_891865 [Pholiota conissans]
MAPYFALLAALSIFVAAAASNADEQALVRRSLTVGTEGSQYAFASPNLKYESSPPPLEASIPDIVNDYELLDTVLVASIDGKFHALNRTSGQTLWSMSSFATTTSVSAPSSLAPLVRTTHPERDPDLIDDSDDPAEGGSETYIIEPQSGDIYMLTSPSAPLQRFPFSMAELVDISPFTSVGDFDTKVFVGRKETSLLVIELETGKIKATLNAECPFVPEEYVDLPIDLDELEGIKPPVSAPTEVYIGRTDYHISIHKKPQPGKPAPVVQELSFSTYGPNNKDAQLQARYRRTHDNTYLQALPNGEVISFRTRNYSNPSESSEEGVGPLWARPFPNTIVAIFDVLQPRPLTSSFSHHRPPFVLLQPQPTLSDLFPGVSGNPPPHLGSAYVGVVEETGSLFALSPDRFPLVVFGSGERHGIAHSQGSGKTLDPPKRAQKGRSGSEVDDIPTEDDGGDVDDYQFQQCVRNPHAPRCLVGVRPLAKDTPQAVGRFKLLIDAPKGPTATVGAQQPMDTTIANGPWTGNSGDAHGGPHGGENTSGNLPGHPHPPRPTPQPWIPRIGDGSSGALARGRVGLEVFIGLLVFALFVLGMRIRKGLGRGKGLGRDILREHEREVAVDSKDKAWEKAGLAVGLKEESMGEHQEMAGAATPLLVESKDADPALAAAAAPVAEATDPPSEENQNALNGTVTPPVSLNDLDGEVLIPPTPTPTKNRPTPVIVDPEKPVNGISADPLETPKVNIEPFNGSNGGAAVAGGDEGEESDGEGEGGPAVTPGGKKRNRRGKRGKKKKAGATVSFEGDKEDDREKDKDKDAEKAKEEEQKPSSIVLTTSVPKPIVQQPSLIVSDTILGFGSHGTVVFQGSLQGRAVAVKRLLQDFVTLASREVSILQESDDHPNVIRYYYQEAHANFLYIALELCPASLADIIEAPDRYREIALNFDPKRALRQIASGLRHLHALKLVHRDIKPQNILVGVSPGIPAGRGGKSYRMLISDFGLCKRLDVDQTSFLPTAHGALGAGTVGWRAPEILRGEVKLDEVAAGDESLSSRGSVATVNGSSSGTPTSGVPTRLTKSVDIFALGCLFYYTLTNGGHPYGDRFEREVNIMRDTKDLSALERFGEEGTEATDLISSMLSFEARARPDTTTILLHPFFWDAARRLNFLQDASDRFEIMPREPKDPNLLALEDGAVLVVGNDWAMRLDKIFLENLGKYRKYDGKSVQDLMRALRNKKHHYQDLPDNVKRHLGPMPEGFLAYFTRRYPLLFLHVHRVVKDTGLHTESMFRAYFELPDN